MSAINIGNITNATFKVGGADCSIYLGSVKLYPQEEPPTPVFTTKYKFTLSDGSVVSGECDGSTAITSADTSAYKATLVEAEIGGCIATIDDNAFRDFKSLANLTIEEGVQTIGLGVFRNCSGLTSIEIPNSVTSIGEQAFYNCSELTSVTIGNSVTTIGSNAFYNTEITSITIPDSVTTISDNAFRYCKHLRTVTIGSGLSNIAEEVFANCYEISSITVDSNNTTYDSRNNCNAIIRTASNGLIYGCKNTVIPNGVTSIYNGAFYGCSGLTSINIPNSVTYIYDEAFYNCSGLTSITIPNSVTNISYCAFNGCSSLTSITIPDSVTSIGYGAFNGCTSLTSITLESLTPPSLTDTAAFDNTKNCPIYTPCESVEAYRTASRWDVYANRIIGYDSCTIYQWVENGTICVGSDLHTKEYRQRSFDGGTTWENTGEERAGTLIESGSSECGTAVTSTYFSASDLWNELGNSTAKTFTNNGVTIASTQDLKLTGSTQVKTCKVQTKVVTALTITTDDNINIQNVTFVLNGNSDITRINNASINLLSNYTQTEGTCKIEGSTRYWLRFKLNSGMSPLQSIGFATNSDNVSFMYIAFNVEDDWQDSLPPSS